MNVTANIKKIKPFLGLSDFLGLNNAEWAQNTFYCIVVDLKYQTHIPFSLAATGEPKFYCKYFLRPSYMRDLTFSEGRLYEYQSRANHDYFPCEFASITT